MSMEQRQCWLDNDTQCYCNNDDTCEVMFSRYAKVVWCNDIKCLFNLSLPIEHHVDRGINYKSFAQDSMRNICTRKDLALTHKEIMEYNRKHSLATCSCRSQKTYSHLHFPDPDSIQGGHIDDPPSSDWTTSTFR